MSDSENFVARWSRLKRDTAKEKTEADAARSDAQPSDADTIAAEQAAEGAPLAAVGLPKAPFDPATLPPIESITAASDIRAFLQTGVPAELTRAALRRVWTTDPATLPPIESITADSDIRAFLQSGVPADLTKAALRRVWTTDPAIRDFIGIAENQWDFTDPTAMPGFGPLEATDDVRELVAQAMGKLGQISNPAVEAALPPQQSEASTSSAIYTSPQERHPQVTGMPVENEVPSKDGSAESSVEAHNSIVNVASQHDDRPAQEEAVPNRRAHGRALPQ